MIDPADQHRAATATDATSDLALRLPLVRESILLTVLALVGAAMELPLAVALKSLDRSKLAGALPFVGVTLILTSMVPLALRLSRQLGLPGAPIIAARISGAKLHLSIRNFLKVTLGYTLLAPMAGGAALALVVVPMLLMRPTGMQLPMSPILSAAPGRIAGVGALVAVAAAISEEIQFRLVLFAIVARVARMFSHDDAGRPGRGAMWCATFVQGYAFGMIHLMPIAAAIFHSSRIALLVGLLMPQTWEGIVFGRLYLRRGLEAAMLAHATMDAALFAIAAVAVPRAPLG